MRLVIDTNVLLVSISSKSKLHWIFKALIDQKITLCVSTDILLEYEEIICREMGENVSDGVMNIIEHLDNIRLIQVYYHFHLLNDKDDNKFVDCAVASNSDFIVTHDNDFNILKTIDFPKVNIINTIELKQLIEN